MWIIYIYCGYLSYISLIYIYDKWIIYINKQIIYFYIWILYKYSTQIIKINFICPLTSPMERNSILNYSGLFNFIYKREKL